MRYFSLLSHLRSFFRKAAFVLVATLAVTGTSVAQDLTIDPFYMGPYYMGRGSQVGAPPLKKFASIEEACKASPLYFVPESTEGHAWLYQYHDYRPNAYYVGFYDCGTMLITTNPAINPDKGPYYMETVAGYYDAICPAPFSVVGSKCVLRAKRNGACPCGVAGAPGQINASTGNEYTRELVYRGSGPFPLEFSLSYNSGEPTETTSASHTPRLLQMPPAGIAWVEKYSKPKLPLNWATSVPQVMGPGAGWNHNYSRSVLSLGDNSIQLLSRENGQVLPFKNTVADKDVNGKLTTLSDSQGNYGWEYLTPEGNKETYNSYGMLASVTNPAGLKHTMTYNEAGQLLSVADSFGHTMRLTYDEIGRPNSLTDPAEQVYQFSYDGKNLAAITWPDGSTRTFLYEAPSFPSALTGIVDENGKRYITRTYDSQGRATVEYFGSGVGRYQVSYSSDGKSATITDPLGAVRTKTFKEILGVPQLLTATQPGTTALQTRTYDANGNLATSTDFNGVKTNYTYDLARNLELTRTEAAGTPEARITSTEWHATLRLPLRVAEPKRLTTYTYDAAGNLLTKTVQATTDQTGAQAFTAQRIGSPRTWTNTYNERGQLLTEKGPRTDVNDTTTYAYSAATGTLLSKTDALGHVITFDNYDANGRVGRIVAPNGAVTELTYTPRGWLSSMTVSAGDIVQRTTYEYDGVGQVVRVVSPDGSEVNFRYDDAHRLVEMADGQGNRITYTLDAMGNRIAEQVSDPYGAVTRQVQRMFDVLGRVQQQTGASL